MNNKNKDKAEILLSALQGKQSISEQKAYISFCQSALNTYKNSLNFDDIKLKNMALDAAISIAEDLIELLNSNLENNSKTIDSLVELSGQMIEACEEE